MDERGRGDLEVALGDRRASAAKDRLESGHLASLGLTQGNERCNAKQLVEHSIASLRAGRRVSEVASDGEFRNLNRSNERSFGESSEPL